MDISDVANYIGQSQYKEFLTNIDKLCRTAFVVLFVRSEATKNEETLLKGMIETVGKNRFKRLPAEPYSHDDLCSMVKKMILEGGIDIMDEKSFCANLSDLVSQLRVNSVGDVVRVTDALIHFADYSGAVPMIDSSSILDMSYSLRAEQERRKVK